jgi:hypothetical protein
MRRRTAGTVQLALLLAALVFVLSGCGLGTATTPPAASVVPSQAPSASASPVQSNVPSASAVGSGTAPSTGPTPTASEEPSTGPTPTDSSLPSPSPSNSASVCSGAKDTPDFYASFAGSVSFPVYCAVLPAGWSLVAGTYRLANGGRITINFRRKSDSATFELDEGSFCADSSGCVPSGTAAGTGPYGDLTGNLVQTSSGFVLVVAKGEKPSWLAVGNGLDQATFTALTGALHPLN